METAGTSNDILTARNVPDTIHTFTVHRTPSTHPDGQNRPVKLVGLRNAEIGYFALRWEVASVRAVKSMRDTKGEYEPIRRDKRDY